jgi:ornithine carbamoyltransferase
MKDLLRTEDLSRDDVELLLATAADFASAPLQASGALSQRSVAIYMTKPSTRTRLASETAASYLGATPIFLRGDDLQIGRGETIADTARVISAFCDALIIRTFSQSDVDQLGLHASIPVINALTDDDHPTQVLADWLTIREKFGKNIEGRKFVYFGDGNNVANAWMMMGAIMGAHIVIASPEECAPQVEVLHRARALAQTHGGEIEVTHDPESAAKDASVLYTDVWMSMGDPEEVREKKFAALSPFAINDHILSLSAADSIFLHCLPAHRGEEVSASVIDGERSVVWREVFHRRSTIQSLLYHLTRGELKGR